MQSSPEVTVHTDGPSTATAVVVLAHGAGAGVDSPFMAAISTDLVAHGLRVCRFNFPYIETGSKRPDPERVLEQVYERVVEDLRSEVGERRLILGGKSLGGRIASHIVASGTECDGLAFLGYPLHPPGRPDRVRDRHLYDISVPMLFVAGTRDPFCPLPTLEQARARLPVPTQLAVIDDGDHSFKVRKSSRRTTEEAWHEVARSVVAWVAQLP